MYVCMYVCMYVQYNPKTVVLLELTVPIDKRMSEAKQRKEDKYEELIEEITTVDPQPSSLSSTLDVSNLVGEDTATLQFNLSAGLMFC